MKPLEYPPADRGLYYQNTFMRHRTMGNVEIRLNHVEGAYQLQAKTRVGTNFRNVETEDLEESYPAGGSYNHGEGQAVYISRRVARVARKSACTDYYNVMWSQFGMGMSREIMWTLVRGPQYSTFSDAKISFKGGDATSRALSADLIVAMTETPNVYTVVCLGTVAGSLQLGKFKPISLRDPLSDIARRCLREVGIPC